MTSADKVKIERYLKENPVTDAQANEILTKADEAIRLIPSDKIKSDNLVL